MKNIQATDLDRKIATKCHEYIFYLD